MKRRNPTSEELYKRFHGRASTKESVIEVEDADFNSHPDLAKLGDLMSLTVGEGIELTGKYLNQPKPLDDEEDSWCVQIDFDQQRPVAVAAEPNGKQIFFVGGDQDIARYLSEFPVDASKEFIVLGPCIRIEYLTEKGFDQFRPTRYFHATGEESGEYPGDNGANPILLFNRVRRKLFLQGGVYTVKPDGIVD